MTSRTYHRQQQTRREADAANAIIRLIYLAIGIVLLIFAAAFTAPAADKWTARDTAGEGLFATLIYVDWKQTLEFTQCPGKYPNHYEINRIIGRHPTRQRVNAVMAGSALAHAGIACALSQPYRGWWQWIWIGVEADTIHRNRVSLGITTAF